MINDCPDGGNRNFRYHNFFSWISIPVREEGGLYMRNLMFINRLFCEKIFINFSFVLWSEFRELDSWHRFHL